MAIPLNGNIPIDCTSVQKSILLRLFADQCHYKLHTLKSVSVSKTAVYNQLPKASRKSTYINIEAAQNIPICDPDNASKPFAKKNWLPRMKTKRTLKCPFDDPPVRFHMEIQYSEAISLTNYVDSDIVAIDENWPDPSPADRTLSTETIGDPYNFDSIGIGSCELILYVFDPEPDNSCSFTSIGLYAKLISLGQSYDYLAGTDLDQYKFADCAQFNDGIGALSGFWTGVTYAHGPIGLIMQLSYSVHMIPN